MKPASRSTVRLRTQALSLAELLDDGALPVNGPAGTQPVTLDGATALGAGPSVEDLVVAPENVAA